MDPKTHLAWGAKVPPAFVARVMRLCANFGWPVEYASWLMACMDFESGGTFSPSIRNAAGSGATGLIQFMPRTAIGLGTSVEKLAALSAVAQLDYVEAYFKPYAKRVASLPDMYMAILLPRAIGTPDNAPLFSGGVGYRQNSALDANSDGVVTKAEAAQRVQARLETGLLPENASQVNSNNEVKPMDPIAATILQTALPKLFGALPDLVSIFKKPDVAARNVEALTKVGDILMASTQAANMQEAVTRVTADPQTAVEANNAIRLSRADIMDIMERMNTMEQGNIKAARDYNTTELYFLETPWVKLKFIHLLSLVFVGFSGIFVSFNWASLTPELKGAVITLMVIAGWNGVRDYWMGSSEGSTRKTELLQGK